jgi:hypothetical protein
MNGLREKKEKKPSGEKCATRATRWPTWAQCRELPGKSAEFLMCVVQCTTVATPSE